MMHKTELMQLNDLLGYLKQKIWEEEVSVNVHDSQYWEGVNEGIDRAYRVLTDLNVRGWLTQEANK